MKRKNNAKFVKAAVLLVLLTLTATSAAQAFVRPEFNNIRQVLYEKVKQFPPMQPLDDPYFTWEDVFETLEFVDPDMSNDIILDGGMIKMKNTYEIWTNPSWTRMKPINLTNNEGQPLSNFAIHLDIEYDSDMQSDYDDLRFKHEDYPTSWLDYWIESYDTSSASVWVEILVIPTGDSLMYLFYGNSGATSQSDFYSVFSDWEEEWDNDEQITYHLPKEGAWDSDVAFGSDVFFVAWEEGQYPLPPWTYVFKQEIRGSIYTPDGGLVNEDFLVYSAGGIQFRDENPTIAYGSGDFFIAWEHYNTPTDVQSRDIYAKMVTPGGSTGGLKTICTATKCQADPCAVYDSVNNRFFLAWEDARAGGSPLNYDIYGQLCDTSGTPIGSNKAIITTGNSQTEPWVAFDNINEQFLIVWEDGETPDVGPFDIYYGLFDEDLNQIGNSVKLADGTSSTDYVFPCVSFCEETELYMVTWNDADISSGDWTGNIWGAILDTSGNIVVNMFQIRSGNYQRTDIVPYLSSSFLVAFNGGGKIWGKLVSSDGTVFTGDVQLSASTSAAADWVNLAFGDNKIFATWEDTRVIYTYPWNGNPDAFGNIWRLNIPSGNEVTSVIDTEKKIILSAQLTSKDIFPDNLVYWYLFDVDYLLPDGTLTFNILDENGNVLIAGAGKEEDLTGINPVANPKIKLQAVFGRSNPSYTPSVDKWLVIYVGEDNDPPITTIKDIYGTMGDNNWYISTIRIELEWTDGQHGSGVNHTYYQIDNEDPELYDEATGIQLPDDPNILCGEWDVYYWSEDKAGNVEDPNGPVQIKMDKAPPYVEIWDPPDRATVMGEFWVQTNATDECSGVKHVKFDTGPPYEDPVFITDPDPQGSDNYKWYCDRLFKKQWKHIIAVVVDYAGHEYEDNIYVYFANNNAVYIQQSSNPVLYQYLSTINQMINSQTQQNLNTY